MDIATPLVRRSLREPVSALALFMGGLAWIAAFWFPAFYTSQGPVEGYWVFATGWMGFAIFQFAWYANLCMLLGIVLMYISPLWAAALSGIAMVVASQAFWFNSIPTGEVDMPILQLGNGFWCWYGSIIALGVGVFLGSEHTEAEKNQTTKNTRIIKPKLRLKQPTVTKPVVIANAAPTPLFSQVSSNTEPVYEAILHTSTPTLEADSGVVSVVEESPVAMPIELASRSFATVPEPELPNFAELTAANEQEYFQLADEVALKPVYTEHLTEDWPPKMSLVVTSDPFKTEPHLEPVATELKSEVDQTSSLPVLEQTKPSAAGFFDPWKH